MLNVFSQAEHLIAFKIECADLREEVLDALANIPDILSFTYDVLENPSAVTIYADKCDLSIAQMQAFIAAIEAAFAVEINLVSADEVSNIDWVLHSRQATPMLQVGNITIAGTHYDITELPSGGKIIRLDAGAAFGTGEHGTTYGCAMAIIKSLKTSSPKSILDMGCGTALLAMVASLLCPPATVLAIDNDAVAVRVANENIRLNKLHNRIKAEVGNGFNTPLIYGKKYDLIIANILAKPICKMSGAINNHLEEGGRIVLSGFYARDIRRVLAYFQGRGFYLYDIIRIEEWAILTMQKH